MKTLFCGCLMLLAFGKGTLSLDPCVQNTVLNDQWRHLANVINNPNIDHVQCDHTLASGWYVFDQGEMVFGACVDNYHCGTHVPFWVNGTKPSVADGPVILNACGKYNDDCCFYQTEVAVKNCGNFYAYYLQPTKGCSLAYCVDPVATCTGDRYSKTGHEPCVDAYPKLTHTPFLTKPVVEGTDFKFMCLVPYPPNYNDAILEVTWLADGHPIKTPELLTGSKRDSVLYGEELAGVMNSNITCAVKTSFADYHTGVTSPPSISNSYWAGINLSSERLTLQAGDTDVALTLTSTLPVVCKTLTSDCKLEFVISTDNENVSPDKCTLTLRPTDWEPNLSHAQTSLVLSPNPSFAPTAGSVTTLTFTSTSCGNCGKEWTTIILPNVIVHKEGSGKGASCSSIGDPHVMTFDSIKRKYTNLHVGQYVMVKRKKTNFRVDARTFSNGRASFNCGVAMRDGTDVIILDMCWGRMGSTYPKLEIRNSATFSNKTEIVQSGTGNQFVFKFPSGAIVTAKQMKNFLNLAIFVPDTFRGDTDGLCGRFDGNQDNDLKMPNGYVVRFSQNSWQQPYQFIDSWKIPARHSLFERTSVPQVTSPNYCTCSNNKFSCQTTPTTIPFSTLCPSCHNINNPMTSSTTATMTSAAPILHVTQTNAVTVTSTTTTTTTTTATTTARTAATTHLPISTTPYVFSYSSPLPPSAMPTISQPDARRVCYSKLNEYSFARECAVRVYNMDLTDLVNVCVTDLELTGDPGMAKSSLDAMLTDCQFAALSNASNYGNGTYKPPPELKPCPGDCSGNGDCVHGVCACAPGFEEEDCSIDHRQPPSFTGVAGGGACAINEEECYLPVLVGGNIKPGDTSCYARAMQKGLNGKWTMDTTATENKAEFLSTNHAVCNLPRLELSRDQAMAGFMVSLSNNHGASSSPERPYYLYNSRCMICHDGNCTIKPDTCVIENTCYDDGDLDLLDNNGACQPLVNNTAWTSDSGASPNAPPSATLNKYTSADVGCFCIFDPSSAECACCQNAGCQCSRAHKHACYDCLHPEMCGQ